MGNKSKYIVAGAIGVFTIVGALAYLQYKKVMEFTLKFKGFKIRSIGKNLVSFDVFLWYFNPASIEAHLVEQEYKIYINDIYVSRGSNGATNVIKAGATSEIGVNIAFDPGVVLKAIGKTWADILLNPGATTLKTEMTLKLKIWGFLPVTIPYTNVVTFKELLGGGTQ